MIITHILTLDLCRPGSPPRVDAVQGDSNTRKVKITLTANGVSWQVPDGATAAVAFLKSDGTRGLYDKLPDGSAATTISGNTVTAILAPQVLTCAGTASVSVVFYDADGDTLATFPFRVTVEKNPAAGEQISNNYYHIQNLAQANSVYNDLVARMEDIENGDFDGQDGYSVFYMNAEVEYPVVGFHSFAISKGQLSNKGNGVKIGDLIISANGTLCNITKLDGNTVYYEPIASIAVGMTEANKEEIVQSVLEALPTWTGGSY